MSTSAGSGLAALAPTRRAILRALKHRGEARAEVLASEIGITVSAVRQHLAGLRADGLVVHREVREGPGRPKHVWSLGPGAQDLFPAAYGDLTLELLDGVAEADPPLVERLFERRRRRRVAAAQARLADRSLAERVEELARILDEDGYLATCEPGPDGTLRIVEHHCAIFAVARRYGQACSSELEFIREVLPDARVERVAHMVQGAHRCAYEVQPR